MKLAPSGETPPETPKEEAIKLTMVEILTTPTGFLRVRDRPPPPAREVLAELKPGEKYRYLETDTRDRLV